MSILRKKRKRVALRQFASAGDLRAEWRRITPWPPMKAPIPRPSPEAGTIRPALTRAIAQPGPAPAYAEELRGFASPDWSFVLEYPYDSDELAPTGWNGMSTIHRLRVAP
jgi:hypothetical protein